MVKHTYGYQTGIHDYGYDMHSGRPDDHRDQNRKFSNEIFHFIGLNFQVIQKILAYFFSLTS